ncbi:MAG: FGGY-family carbohydrate kinase [Thermoflexales bacterium]|nr:FGGY-family carbohydrate kinase [Thermoflexales bacterium]
MSTTQDAILAGRTALGIELGSTRIKAVLIGSDFAPLASGAHEWENRYENGIWTYHLDDVWSGLQSCYAALKADVQARYGVPLRTVGALGISAMMHGYLPFDREGNLLAPFRTWRNTITAQAAERLTERFQFNIPQRWSVAHLYQAMLNGESHVRDIAFLTTLAGYVHWKLTDQKVLGIGDASGMFPVDSTTNDHHAHRLALFDAIAAEMGMPWTLREILPAVRLAGQPAGRLTEQGARLLDPSGELQPGIPLCPPEGDAGTGMVATNSVAPRTGNISAGTSVFAMIVLEHDLSRVYPEVDLVTTPAGRPVAMVHSNNCTSDLNAWVALFREAIQVVGCSVSDNILFERLYRAALEGDPDAGGLLAYNYVSGEHITHFEEGRPLFVRTPTSRFTLANFMRAHLFAALGALKIGMDLLFNNERLALDRLTGHGGFFKTPEVGQRLMAAALNAPVAVMETAGEGGAWGIALLAAYLQAAHALSLEDFLAQRVFANAAVSVAEPRAEDVQGFAAFMARYQRGLSVERAAVEAFS